MRLDGFLYFFKEGYYAKTKFQEFIFTLITSGCMIFIMGVYNWYRTEKRDREILDRIF